MDKRCGEGKRPLLLVVNDDGIEAPGIQALARVASAIGEVVVSAPEREYSGAAMSLSGGVPLRSKAVPDKGAGLQYAVAGTPAECVKLGLHHLGGRLPDLVLSGINHGGNAALYTMHSGTVGAAITAAMQGCRALAFSLLQGRREVDMTPYLPYCEELIRLALRDLKPGCVLNVNFPRGEPKGFKVCRQARARLVSDLEQRQDVWGRDYYWFLDRLLDQEPAASDSDLAALKAGYISVVPVTYDWTDYKVLNDLQSWQ